MAGRLLVAQSGGPTAVINASLAGVVQTALRSRQIAAVYGAVNGIQGVLQEELLDIGREDPRTLGLLSGTPGAALGTSRLKPQHAHYRRLLDVCAAHDIRYFCFIGGNDSMTVAYNMSRTASADGYELSVIGIPKTVDNDLAYTDHCPGYGSAARFVAATMRDTGLDTRAGALSTPVKIVEVMGRHAGWLTASAALARDGILDGAPHLIYVPERPVSLDAFLGDVETQVRRRGFVVVALSEGVRDLNGEFLGLMTDARDAFGHQQLGGVSAILAAQVTASLGIKARFEKPDTMQRSSASVVSKVDRDEAFGLGQRAVGAVLKGTDGKMVTLNRAPGSEYVSHIGLVDLHLVAGVERLMPPAYLCDDCRDVTPAFMEYVRPLIGGPLPSVAVLVGHRVARRLPQWDA